MFMKKASKKINISGTKTQSQERSSWIRLDNVSKIFPATANLRDTKVFRMTAELREAVDPEVLQQAVDDIMPRFPTFRTVLRRGVFWYYFEQSDKRCKVEAETEDLYEPLYIQGKRMLPFRVLYYGSRINVEIFHAVSDGAGAVAFLKSLLGQYLLLRHPEVVKPEDIRSLNERLPLSEKLDDSFRRHFRHSKILKSKQKKILENSTPTPAKKEKSKKKRKRAWRYKGTKLMRQRASLIEGTMSTQLVIDAAHRHNTTLTIYIAAVYARAIWEVRYGDKPRPIVLAIPVNLRPYFRSSTERNFFIVMNVTLAEPAEEEAHELDWWIKAVGEGFRKGLQKEKFATRAAELLKLETNPLLRIVPISLKDLILRIAHRVSDQEVSSSVSNVGRIDLPEQLKSYVWGCYASVATRSVTVTAISANGQFAVSFTSVYQEAELQYRFFTALQGDGVPVEITSNRQIIQSAATDASGKVAAVQAAEGINPSESVSCPNCGCAIRGNKASCPLDNEPLSLPVESCSRRDVFPVAEQKTDHNLLIRLFAFISVAAMVISLIIDRVLNLPVNLPLMVLLGIISTWSSVGAVVTKRRQVSKIVSWQVTILALLFLAWDWLIGWQGWSLNYAVPITFMAAQATLYILARALRLKEGDYLVYLLLCAFFGLLPLLFLIFGWVTMQLPSIISVGVSILMIVGAFIFQGGAIRHELTKRFHI